MADEPTTPAGPPTTTGTTTRGAEKRKATSDLTEPADKKSRTSKVVTREPDNPSGSSNPGGVMTLLANHFGSPFPIADTQYIVVDTADMADYLGTIWDALIEVIYPDCRYQHANVITRNNFILVARYLLKARVDHIYASCSGRRPPRRIAIPREYEVPKCLSDLANAIGPVIVGSGAFTVIPEPEAVAPDANLNLDTQVTFAMLTAFSSLVKAAASRGLIRTGFIATTIEGSAWWLLSARDPANLANIAANMDSTTVVATFKEWTPADGVMCALVQRQNNGLIPGIYTGVTWSFDTVRGVSGLRRSFNLDA